MSHSLLDNRDYYDQFAAGYERERHDGYHALIDELEVDLALRYGRGGSIFEAGCGTGLILDKLRPHARRVTGLDLSAGMLQRARGRALPVVQGSIARLPFSDGEFDLVCSFKVLAHIESITEAIAELARVTRPGGHLLLEFYNPWSLRYLIKRLKRPTPISSQANDEAVYTRYDTLAQARAYLPPGCRAIDLRGVRVVTPASTVFKLPGVGSCFGFLERRLCDVPGIRQLGGFLIVVAKKDGEVAPS